MLNVMKNWLMNVAAVFVWKAIMLPIRIVLGCVFAISKHMPEKVEVPYTIIKKEDKPSQGMWS